MALTTLYFQRRDLRRAALIEVETLAVLTGDNNESPKGVDMKKQQTEIASA